MASAVRGMLSKKEDIAPSPKAVYQEASGRVSTGINEAVERINPLKLYQYLAGGNPVVSTAIPSVKPFADVVAWTKTREEFLAATERALAEAPELERREARRAVARRYTWDAVAEHQLEIFRHALATHPRRGT